MTKHSISIMRSTGEKGPTFQVDEVGLEEIRRLLRAYKSLFQSLNDYNNEVYNLMLPYRKDFFRSEDG